MLATTVAAVVLAAVVVIAIGGANPLLGRFCSRVVLGRIAVWWEVGR